jgi:hypothetical protein
MHIILFLIVGLIAAPFMLFALPVVIYFVPFIAAGLLFSLAMDSAHHRTETLAH